jgi:hypothetical protein
VTAGYSGTPLPKKLGIKPGMRAAAVHAPKQYTKLLDPPAGVRLGSQLAADLEFIHAFFRSTADLDRTFPRLKASLATNGTLWISWPKKSSPLAGDLDEYAVRRIGLAHGLVDVKVCAVDEDWSGLKFVRRLRDR